MIDSHCHLDFPIFDRDRDAVIQTSLQAGVSAMLVPGTQASRWHKQINLCRSKACLSFALGLHPYFLNEYHPAQLVLLDKLIEQHANEVLAVGEIGLDFAIEQAPGLQVQVFEQQLQLAKSWGLPVILHHRKSHNEIVRLLKKHQFSNGGVVHAYSGSYQQAKAYVDMGFCLGVGGTITYPRAAKTADAFRKLPLSALLLETDAPDMPVCGKQGQRNSPLNLPIILNHLASIRSESSDEIEQATDLNFAAVFLRDRQCDD